jgi:hypothetical protein
MPLETHAAEAASLMVDFINLPNGPKESES